MSNTNPAVLKNKGARITLAVVSPEVHSKITTSVGDDGELVRQTTHTVGWVPSLGAHDEPITMGEWVRFTNASLADVQRFYGDMEAFNKATETRPNEAIAVAIGAMLGSDIFDEVAMAEIHARLIPEEFLNYSMVIGALLAMANGVDPTKAARMIDEGAAAMKHQMAQANEEMDKVLDEMAEEMGAPSTPSTDGSPSGSESDEPTPSSGS